MSPRRWLPEWDEPASEPAWREVVRRYLRAYGPAAREEFARWWGMQPAPAGRILRASADELVEVDVEGYRALALAEDVAAMRAAPPRVPARLLPGFDVYVAGTRPRASLVDGRFEDRVFRKAGWISPVVLVDGMVAGVWSHPADWCSCRGHGQPVQAAERRGRAAARPGRRPPGRLPRRPGGRLLPGTSRLRRTRRIRVASSRTA